MKGLQIKQLRPERSISLGTRSGRMGDFSQLFLNLRMRGQYQQLGDFLQSLETQPFYVKVDELNVQRTERRSAVPLYIRQFPGDRQSPLPLLRHRTAIG